MILQQHYTHLEESRIILYQYVCPPSCSMSGSTARDECGSGNSTLGAECTQGQYVGKQIPVSRAKSLRILVGKTHIWSCLELAQIAADKEERKEGL